MQKYAFIVGQPLPSPGVEGLYRLAHVEPPIFSCFMCMPAVVPAVFKKIPQVLALGADDMRHLDGWVFFNFKVHGEQTSGALLEPKIVGLLSRASVLLDIHLGYDILASPRVELDYLQEDALNPSADVHLGIFEGNERALEQSVEAAYPDGWELGWIFSGEMDNGVISLCLHIDTGLAMRARGMSKPYFDEGNMRIAITDEQRSRLTAQGKMFYSMQMGEMKLTNAAGQKRIVAPALAPPPALDATLFPNVGTPPRKP